MNQIQTNTEIQNQAETNSNLSKSAQECMKRLPALTDALRQSQLISQINEVMRKNPHLSYGDVIDSVLRFDEVNKDCINKVRVVGDAKGETILNNYGRECTAAIKVAGEYCKPEDQLAETEIQANYMVELTGYTEGRLFELEKKVSEITQYQIPEVKMLLKSLPAVIDVGLTQDQAQALAKDLEAFGGQVKVEQRQL